MTTICSNCRFHRIILHNSAAPNVWYNHFCEASPLPEAIDSVTGEKGYASQNSLGMKVITENPYSYCRDVNDGNCPMYESD